MTPRLEIFGLVGIAEIHPRDDLAGMIVTAARSMEAQLADGDVVVVTQKIVSKAEGRLVRVDPDDPRSHVDVVAAETVRVLRRRGDLVITETSHGFVCANAGVDLSNGAGSRSSPSTVTAPPGASGTASGLEPGWTWR